MVKRQRRGWGWGGRRLVAAISLFGPILAWGCSKTIGVDVPPDDVGPGGTGTVSPEVRCGAGGIECGDEGCCLAGNVCSTSGRCVPNTPCQTNEDCSADSQCGGGECVAYERLPAQQRFNSNCRTPVDLSTLVPQVQCQWPKPGDPLPAVEPNKVQVIGTPMVVDFDFDESPEVRPSIVFVSYEGNFAQETGVLRVIDGRTCELQDTIIGLNPFTPEVPVALGDINADGRPDIVAADEAEFGVAVQSGIAAFEIKGDGSTTFKELSRIASSGTGIIKGFAIHDVDDDEYPEILTEKTILGFDPELNGLANMAALQRAQDQPQLTAIEPPVVIDVDGDRRAEIVTAQGVFYWNVDDIADKPRTGQEPLWRHTQDEAGAFIAMADLGSFPTGLPQGADSAELVIVGLSGELWVKKVDGSVVLNLASAKLAGGPPIIADFDGDGRMEFAAPGQRKLTVFDLDCSSDPDLFNQAGCGRGAGTKNANAVLWSVTTQGAKSGAAVFDFDGDGRAEVVHADQCFMRIYDGVRGNVIFSSPRASLTQWEYPVVADVDGDGFSEIVTASNVSSVICPETDPANPAVRFEASPGVTVWREADDRWLGSRPIWNQHNYFVTNVKDDGTIAPMSEVTSHWDLPRGGGPNSFRQNVQGATGSPLDLVDVTTSGRAEFTCVGNQDLAEVTVDLCNRGAAPLRPEDASLTLADSAQPTRVLCRKNGTALITQDLAPGACSEIKCEIPITRGAAAFDITVMGDPTRTVDECFENNNSSTISRVSCLTIVD